MKFRPRVSHSQMVVIGYLSDAVQAEAAVTEAITALSDGAAVCVAYRSSKPEDPAAAPEPSVAAVIDVLRVTYKARLCKILRGGYRCVAGGGGCECHCAHRSCAAQGHRSPQHRCCTEVPRMRPCLERSGASMPRAMHRIYTVTAITHATSAMIGRGDLSGAYGISAIHHVYGCRWSVTIICPCTGLTPTCRGGD